MKVLVCGGRDYHSPAHIWVDLDILHDEFKFTKLIQGGARGVDKFAKEWAVFRQVEVWTTKANWEKFGKAAGPKRNARMLEWEPDMVVAFPGGRGTTDMIKQSIGAGYKFLRKETTCHVYTKSDLPQTK